MTIFYTLVDDFLKARSAQADWRRSSNRAPAFTDLVLCRRTRQIVAYAVGARGEATCRRLWNRIPSLWRQGLCFTNFWSASFHPWGIEPALFGTCRRTDANQRWLDLSERQRRKQILLPAGSA